MINRYNKNNILKIKKNQLFKLKKTLLYKNIIVMKVPPNDVLLAYLHSKYFSTLYIRHLNENKYELFIIKISISICRRFMIDEIINTRRLNCLFCNDHKPTFLILNTLLKINFVRSKPV